MEDKLENLDDDFKAIEAIVNRSHKRKNDDGMDDEAVPSSSKFAKSLKQYVEKPKQKFSDLKSVNIKGD
jgi:hypothetical protein